MSLGTQVNSANSWKQLVYYGEVVGFVLVWIIGGLLLVRTSTPDASLAGAQSIDSVADAGFSDLRSDKLDQ